MEVYYRREMRHNYLVIIPEQSAGTRYECGMLANNSIEGLLKFRISCPEGETCFYYEITSRQPLSRMMEGGGLTLAELRSLIIGIAGVLAQIEVYLLPEEQLLLEPDYIYVDPESFRIFLCLLPGADQDFPASVERLLQYLLSCVDHQDKECVVLAYGLYQECQKENFGIGDLLRLVRESTSAVVENPDKDELNMLVREAADADDYSLYMQTDSSNALLHSGSGKGKRSFGIAANRGNRISEKQSGRENFSINQNAQTGAHSIYPDRAGKKRGWRKRIDKVVSQFAGKDAEEKETSNWDTWQEMLKEPEQIREVKVPEAEPMTVLLADLSEKRGKYRLKALQPGISDIILESFPFIIGKNSSLADYHLDYETVSRLHVKIDRDSEGFQITDLNSTNGTSVRGRLLENNECGLLQVGDEVHIAEWKYRFESN